MRFKGSTQDEELSSSICDMSHFIYIHNHRCEFVCEPDYYFFLICAYRILTEFQNMKQPKTYKNRHKKKLRFIRLMTSLQGSLGGTRRFIFII